MRSAIRDYVISHEDYDMLSRDSLKKLFQGIDFFKEYYSANDETHDIYHVIDVTIRALRMNSVLKLGVTKEKIIVAGLAHDMFSVIDRAEHHKRGFMWIYVKKGLPILNFDKFKAKDKYEIARAVHEHRASYRGDYTTVLSELISAADRDKPDLETILTRVYKCAKDEFNIFEIDKGKEIPDIEVAAGNLRDIAKVIYNTHELPVYKTYVHIIEKYHEKGYARRNHLYDAYYGKQQQVFLKQINELTIDHLTNRLNQIK